MKTLPPITLIIATLFAILFTFSQCQLDASTTTSSKSPTVEKEKKEKTDIAHSAITNSPQQPIFKKTFEWLPKGYEAKNMLANRIAVPKGYQRAVAKSGSFAEWLRHLPLQKGKPDVHLYNGTKKSNQQAQEAVFDIDVGTQDLQQCADAVMRLRAEYLYSTSQKERIQFNFTSGDRCKYTKWKQGYRPVIRGNKVSWRKSAKASNSYSTFRKYLTKVFQFAGTYSLSQELKKVASISGIRAGDVFIQGGFPGHAIIVLDVVEKPTTGDKLFLLAQSYMPAQEIHLLRNANSSKLNPWYSIDFGETLYTPEWNFKKGDLKRF